MSHDMARRFFPVLWAAAGHGDGLATLTGALNPLDALARCQDVPAVVHALGVDVKNPTLLPVAVAGALLGWILGLRRLLAAAPSGPRWPRGRFAVGWAYLLYGCMNVSGLGFHCLLPREPDAEGLPFQVLYAIDVGCTATSCLSLAVAAAALTRVADDRSPAVRRMLLGTYALLPVLCLGVAHAALPDGRLNLFNELVYLVGLLGAYAAVSALAAYRLAFATLRWRWMAAAILVSSIATLTIVFDGWLCLNFGYLINAMNGGYLACVLVMACLLPVFDDLIASVAAEDAHKKQ